MKVYILMFLTVMLSGCSFPSAKPITLSNDETLCTAIVNIEAILPNHVVLNRRNTDVGVAIPSTPIDVKFKHDSDGTLVQLSEVINQDNIALRSFQYLLAVGRNAAPCDPDNIRMFWEATNNLVDKTYLLKNEMITNKRKLKND